MASSQSTADKRRTTSSSSAISSTPQSVLWVELIGPILRLSLARLLCLCINTCVTGTKKKHHYKCLNAKAIFYCLSPLARSPQAKIVSPRPRPPIPV